MPPTTALGLHDCVEGAICMPCRAGHACTGGKDPLVSGALGNSAAEGILLFVLISVYYYIIIIYITVPSSYEYRSGQNTGLGTGLGTRYSQATVLSSASEIPGTVLYSH